PALPPQPTPTFFPYTTLFRSIQTDRWHYPLFVHIRGEVVSCRRVDTKALADKVRDRLRFEFAELLLKVAPIRPPAVIRRSQVTRSEEHTSELQSRFDLVCRLL